MRTQKYVLLNKFYYSSTFYYKQLLINYFITIIIYMYEICNAFEKRNYYCILLNTV